MSFAASREQRLAVKDKTCAYCGREGVDPAHLCPRSLGGIYTVVIENYPEQYQHLLTHLSEQGAEWRLRNERPS